MRTGLSSLGRMLAARAVMRSAPRMVLNFLRYAASIRHVRRRGPDKLRFTPPSVVIWVTVRCNRRCFFCHYAGELNPANANEFELDPAGFSRIIRLPIIRNAVRIALYGGEPLLNRSLFAMVRMARKAGHLVTVNTNGTLLRERLDEIRANPPDLITIGAYPENFKLLAAAIPSVARHVPVRLIGLISRATLQDIPRLLELAAETGVRDVSLERTCPNAPGAEPPLSVDDSDYTAIRVSMERRYGKIAIRWPTAATEPNCGFFWHSLFLDAKGRVGPCCVWPLREYEGNVFEDGQIWNSARMQQLRKNMREGRFDARCRQCGYLFDDPMRIWFARTQGGRDGCSGGTGHNRTLRS